MCIWWSEHIWTMISEGPCFTETYFLGNCDLLCVFRSFQNHKMNNFIQIHRSSQTIRKDHDLFPHISGVPQKSPGLWALGFACFAKSLDDIGYTATYVLSVIGPAAEVNWSSFFFRKFPSKSGRKLLAVLFLEKVCSWQLLKVTSNLLVVSFSTLQKLADQPTSEFFKVEIHERSLFPGKTKH